MRQHGHPRHVGQSDIFFVEVSVPRMKQNGHKWTPRDAVSPLFGEISLDRSSTAAAGPPLSYRVLLTTPKSKRKKKKKTAGGQCGWRRLVL